MIIINKYANYERNDSRKYYSIVLNQTKHNSSVEMRRKLNVPTKITVMIKPKKAVKVVIRGDIYIAS